MTAQSTESSIVREAFFLVNQGPEERARAIVVLTRTAEYEAADRVLKSIQVDEEPPEALAEIASQLGPSLLIRLLANESVSVEANAVLQASMEAQRALRESPETLAEGIAKVQLDSSDERLAGARILMSGGNASVVAIVNALVTNSAADKNGSLIRVLGKLGKGGADALMQYANYGSNDQRVRALLALQRLDHPLFEAAVFTNLHAADASGQLKSLAAEIAQRRFGFIPSRDASVDALKKIMLRELDQANADRTDQSIVMGWTLANPSASLEPIRTYASVLQRRDAVDVGAMLNRIGDLDPTLDRTIAMVDIGYRQEVDSDWGDASQVQELLTAYPWLGDPLELLVSLQEGIELKDVAATIPLLKLIQQGQVDAPRVMLLHAQPGPTALVELASSPQPRIRFEAASAIAAIEASEFAESRIPYAGSSLVNRTFREMALLSEMPIVVVLETRRGIRSQLTNLLRSLGYQVRIASSVQEALQTVAAGGDIRMILSKALTADLPPIELVDRVRRMKTGSHLPIVFYLDDTSSTVNLSWVDSPRWSAVTDVMELPYTASGMAPVLEKIEEQEVVRPLSPGDRSLFRRIGRAQFSGVEGEGPNDSTTRD